MTVARILANKGRSVVTTLPERTLQEVSVELMRHGIGALVVMPITTPEIKVQAVANLGAEIVLHGDDYDAANEHAVVLARDRSEERRVGKECLTQCRSRWSPYH